MRNFLIHVIVINVYQILKGKQILIYQKKNILMVINNGITLEYSY
jgi:hypothetical protein